ncbi:MAG: diacylglycerol kinase family lipid kinase [Lentisphaeria bacterium]
MAETEKEKRICIIANPVAGRRARAQVEKAYRRLLASGVHVDMWYTEFAGHATELAAKAVQAKYNTVVAAGGDGTVNEVLNGMVHSETELAILPLGTTNVLAREVGLHRRRKLMVDTILNGRAEKVHVGRANDHYFLSMAGIGFDGHVVHALNLQLKSWFGKLAYVIAALKVLTSSRPRRNIEVNLNDGDGLKCSSLIVGNGKYYGGSFEVTPGASLDNPSLVICAFEGETRRGLVSFALGVLFKQHTSFRNITVKSAQEFSAKAANTVHVEVDGDYLGILPLDFSLERHALTILRPAKK